MINTQIKFKSWRRILSFSACFLLVGALSISCKKNSSKFGTDALDPETLLNSGGSDAYPLSTYSVIEDSFPTDNQANALLGSMHDPKIGITTSTIYTQFTRPGLVTHPAGSVPVIDSVVLSLNYSGSYGKLTEQTFEVYQLTDDLHIDSTYYAFSETFSSLINLVVPGTEDITPNVKDSVLLADGSKVPAHLRLRLDDAWGYNMMNEAINGTNFNTVSSFKTWFKGLKIQVQDDSPAAGTGGILYFDLESGNTAITFYYKLQGDTVQQKYKLIIDDNCADYNHVEVDNSTYHIASTFDNPTNGSTQFYAEAFKSRAKIEFPTVNDIPEGSFIQGAVLELPVSYQSGTLYYPSSTMAVILDGGDNYFQTGLVTYDASSKTYLIDLRDYVQNIVNGNSENNGIFINPALFTGTAERTIFNGSNTTYKKKPRLIIKYTQF